MQKTVFLTFIHSSPVLPTPRTLSRTNSVFYERVCQPVMRQTHSWLNVHLCINHDILFKVSLNKRTVMVITQTFKQTCSVGDHANVYTNVQWWWSRKRLHKRTVMVITQTFIQTYGDGNHANVYTNVRWWWSRKRLYKRTVMVITQTFIETYSDDDHANVYTNVQWWWSRKRL